MRAINGNCSDVLPSIATYARAAPSRVHQRRVEQMDRPSIKLRQTARRQGAQNHACCLLDPFQVVAVAAG
jgi:hypothetical protein